MTEVTLNEGANKPVDVLVDPNKQIWITRGVPLADDNSIFVPDSPHIFLVDDLEVSDANHSKQTLNNVNVVLAHVRKGQRGWEFGNGQNVSHTINVYNEWAGTNQSPAIKFVIACNETVPDDSPIPIKIYDLVDSSIVYSSDNPISVYGHLNDKKTYLRIDTSGKFEGLDKLIESNKIQQSIELK
ncbi:MAG: hypothetical protein US96_C0014G0024 [Candidatus Woesebacteria bacterium GW2011_GWB1_38_5b]|uniref:Uncharacterized protein n=1 Tax=Candidatus Woesebacteria bacterium GW2011_GWB1_38_5b TaxID=1618569 RepID=A0A0G0NDU0_9BACT|nr:MAG: hypothetical protein US96_C0014G0024 [Candidatus Woesebacteria bacterium GW2011_GWB1_38_5b]